MAAPLDVISVGEIQGMEYLLYQVSHTFSIRPKKRNCLFPVTVREKKGYSVGRKKKNLHYFFCQKCVFYACFFIDWESGGQKNFRVGIFLNKNILG